VPGIGDVPTRMLRMIANVKGLTGAVPFAGNLLDVVWRANREGFL
jgi:hypothetical protein